MILPDTVAAVLAGSTVRAALLVYFDFLTKPSRVWGGMTELIAGGETWNGIGKYGTVDGISTRSDMAAEKMTFTLSGIWPDLVTIAKQQSGEVKGQTVIVYIQFFDENWKTLDDPVAVKSMNMDQMTYNASGPDQRTINLTAESLFAARGAAQYAYYTDRDQNSRFPGDRGLELMSSMIYRQVAWPDS